MSIEEGAASLREYLQGDNQILSAGKLGTAEFDALYQYLGKKKKDEPCIFASYIVKAMTVNAGLFAREGHSLYEAIEEWCRTVLDALGKLTHFVLWNPANLRAERQIAGLFCPDAKLIQLRSLEPYYSPESCRFSANYSGKIAVVFPFTETLQKQWPLQPAIWSKLPGVMWSSRCSVVGIRTGYSPIVAGSNKQTMWPPHIISEGWKAAVAYVIDEVVASGASLALIGCGSLSIPIVAALHKKGISAIHTGGATQILFGIKGGRWEKHTVIREFFNEAWSTPASTETPDCAGIIEGGCYW